MAWREWIISCCVTAHRTLSACRLGLLVGVWGGGGAYTIAANLAKDQKKFLF